MLKKVLLAILDNFEGYVSQVLLAFFVLILLLQIFLRQFGHPLYWTEELARYSFVWFVFFGAFDNGRLCGDLFKVTPMLIEAIKAAKAAK